ncbi:conserved hypothetical protein [Histoplasma capsulatum var. duboisii H88]|uniref:Rho-GAP domain-containing protein n=1 Tax=Ajellomyces capsulatus (strain H88) TaxID=544711 RepID=F0UH86_AJEC8|nr:conserved hypothetical protein [Histoplasma capsulatum var. duboisii H88]QSS55207.1 hypothetical protein I7I53_03027 [Histoplasma capsulatum var. duboisii H88]
MGFSEALRYLSRLYRRSSKNNRSNITAPSVQTKPTNDPKHTHTCPFVTVIEPRQEGRKVADNHLPRIPSDQQIDGIQPSRALVESRQVVRESKIPIETVKKARTPPKSHFENLQIEKSSGRIRGSPVCKSRVSDHSEDKILSDGLRGAIGDENHQGTAGPAPSKDDCVGSNPGRNSSKSKRQFSNQTLLSDESSDTVQRRPSKRCRSPIATMDSKILSENDSQFSDIQSIRGSCMISPDDILKPSGLFAFSERDPNSCSRNESHRSCDGSAQSTCAPVPSRISTRSSENISNRIVSDTTIPQRHTLRSMVLNRLRISIDVLEIVLPTKSQENISNPVEEAAGSPRRSDSFLGRIRSVKSNLGLNRNNSGRRALRRIQTFANLPVQYHIGELRGKRLQDLARLGGLSYLNLPEGYGPRNLALPTCFASTMGYLLENGIGVYDLHDSHDNNDVVLSLYSEYANQVLSAALKTDTIDKTTRAVRPPTAFVPQLGSPSGRNTGFMHDVSMVFRHLLCGIPGGILGSVYLGEVLQRIQQHEFKTSLVIKDPYRSEYRLDLPLPTAAKIRLIALALAGLTNDLQLNLICAVFGLLSFTVDENAKKCNAPDYKNNSCSILPDSQSLDRIFSFVLVDPKSITLIPDGDSNLKDTRICYEGLVKMIIDHWKDIYMQLTWMEGF